MSKWIYHFGSGAAEGNMALKNILGGKELAWQKCHHWDFLFLQVLQSQQMFAIIIFTRLNWPEGLQEKIGSSIVALEEKVESVLVQRQILCWYLFVQEHPFP